MPRPATASRDVDPTTFWRRCAAELTMARVGWVVGLALAVALVLAPIFKPSWLVVFGRTLFVAVALLLAYTGAGQWRRGPLPRWGMQATAVVLVAPLATLFMYALSVGGDVTALFGPERVNGMLLIGGCALVLGLVVGWGAMVRERYAVANAQALRLQLELETLERQAADARLAMLQSQIEPHFLFNTLANVQALVESGSPRAGPVLQSLIAYLRAAMPHLHEGAPTLAREEALVRAYLELMRMRMPDRLAYTLNIDPTLHALRVPPLTLLTLVENAVRHGIDPSEAGGSIEVRAERTPEGGVRLVVRDTGRGLDENHAPGIGLSNLRERLEAAYGDQAVLTLSEVSPHGVQAQIDLPARGAAWASTTTAVP